MLENRNNPTNNNTEMQIVEAVKTSVYPYFIYQKGQIIRGLNGQKISVSKEDSLKYALKVNDGGYNFMLTFRGQADNVLTDKHIRILRALFNCYQQTEAQEDDSKIISLKAIYNAYILEIPSEARREIPKRQEKELIEALDLLGCIRTKIDVKPLSAPKTESERKLVKDIERSRFKRRDSLIDIAIDQVKWGNGQYCTYVIIKNKPLYFQLEEHLIRRITTRTASLYSTPSIARYTDDIIAIKWELVADIERIKSDPKQSNNILLERYYNLVEADTKYKKKRIRETIESLIVNFAENGLIVVPYLDDIKDGKRTIFKYPVDEVTGEEQKNKGYRHFSILRQGINARPRNSTPRRRK